MNGAPDWQDGECCFRCRTQFTLVARKHHCRNCGCIFCAKCSSNQIPLPKLNIEKNVRVCDGCYEKLVDKNEDSLALALDKDTGSDSKTKAAASSSNGKKTNSKSSTGSSKSGSETNTKLAANASAPSEQDLKEEEELQLALALSLSEAPAKVSFPDCRQLEEPTTKVTPAIQQPQQQSPVVQPVLSSDLDKYTNTNLDPLDPLPIQQPPSQPAQVYFQPPDDQTILDRDQELFRFVAEVQSTSEVFTNRINSNKLRNRPIANDSAIQSLFLKLTNMHTKLLEYIKFHDEERAGYEAIHDKLSQITDARAALDALREEHQEKIRQEAAEAERQRQSQLASKLEMMREKKSQMMQYQREIALQRIQAQEMMLRQQPNQAYQPPPHQTSATNQVYQPPPAPTSTQAYQPPAPVSTQAYQPPAPESFQNTQAYQSHVDTSNHVYQQNPVTSQAYQAPTSTTHVYQSTPSMTATNIFQTPPAPIPQQVMHPPTQQQTHQVAPKVEDDTPLISFDD